MAKASSAVSLLACPSCAGPLADWPKGDASGVVRCATCGPYPVLAGVPVLVPFPAAWCAAYREPALASLAERGLDVEVALEVLRAFADAAPRAEPLRFGDDWTRDEAEGVEAVGVMPGPVSHALAALLDDAAEHAPAAWLLARLPQNARVAEVGCGAGRLSAKLAQRAKALVVLDLSLRAVLLARERARRVRGAQVAAAVADAEALPLAPGALDVVVAEQVVDLLDDVPAFLEGLKRSAPLTLLTTPEPGLGLDDEEVLARLVTQAGLRIAERADGLPWVRRGSARFIELYLVQALALTSRRKR